MQINNQTFKQIAYFLEISKRLPIFGLPTPRLNQLKKWSVKGAVNCWSMSTSQTVFNT